MVMIAPTASGRGCIATATGWSRRCAPPPLRFGPSGDKPTAVAGGRGDGGNGAIPARTGGGVLSIAKSFLPRTPNSLKPSRFPKEPEQLPSPLQAFEKRLLLPRKVSARSPTLDGHCPRRDHAKIASSIPRPRDRNH